MKKYNLHSVSGAQVNFNSPKIFFQKNLVTFKIKNLATCNCVKSSSKAALPQGWGREVPDRVRVGDAKFVWYGQVR